MTDGIITAGGRERLPQSVDLLAEAFKDDPLITYMLCKLNKEQRYAYIHEYFKALLTAAAYNGGSFEEINDWSSCAVWVPPGAAVDNPLYFVQSGLLKLMWNCGLGGCWRMLGEFQSQANKIKKKALKDSKFHYLFFIATRLENRGQGFAAALIKKYQTIAAQDKLPLWLEATTELSMEVYSKCGFELVQEIPVGIGKCDKDGNKKKGGEGTKAFSMVWWPPKEVTRENKNSL